MIDVRILRGVSVRTGRGQEGRIVDASPGYVRLAWNEGHAESIRRSSSRLVDDIEVLTLNRGWQPLGWVLSAKKVRSDDARQLKQSRAAMHRGLREMIAEARERLGGK